MTMTNSAAIGLGLRMSTARRAAGLEQADMASRLGVGRTTISNWERGISEPGATQFVQWAALTGQPLSWLAEGINAQAAASNDAAAVNVRHEGFEPPTFWFGAYTLAFLITRHALGRAFPMSAPRDAGAES